MLHGRPPPGTANPIHQDLSLPSAHTPSQPSSSSLADNLRALREAPSSKSNTPSSRSGARPKHVPSPLQHSSSLANAQGPQSPPQSPSHAHKSSLDPPQSPREKLEARLASETSTTDPFTNTTGPGTLPHAPQRTVSAPFVVESPPVSPVAMQAPLKPQTRPAPPRTSSIDSAVSSISSASQSFRSNASHAHKFSQDASAANAPDVASLILAAGSPEAALNALWKEKQSASAHNAQLWRLVEKQRTMILGLNKDLERTLKDKERYRKKLKDLSQAAPMISGAAGRDEGAPDGREPSQSPAESERPYEPQSRSNSALDSTDARPLIHKATQQKASLPLRTSPTEDSPIQPSDSVSVAGSTRDAGASPTDSHKGSYWQQPELTRQNEAGKPTVSGSSVTVQIVDAPNPVSAPTRQIEQVETSRLPAPSVSITQATPVIGSGGFEKPQAAPQRKPPPAPLNLNSAKPISNTLHQAKPEQDTDSDYDDVLEVDEIPQIERGRRKTREDDDRAREILHHKEDEARSRPKKSKSKSKSKPPTEQSSPAQDQQLPDTSPLLGVTSLPSSPRMVVAPGSLNAILSPAGSETSSHTQRSVISAPLMSPGLPLSPRPGDRPVGAPNPRLPTKSIASPPLSPRGLPGQGMPLSPRAPKQPIPLPPNTPLSFTSPHLARAESYAKESKQATLSSESLLQPPQPLSTSDMDLKSPPTLPDAIDRSLMIDQYPQLLLPPNALPSINVKVFSSRLRPSRMSFMATKPIDSEDPVFILAIYARSSGKQLWRNEKTIAALPQLDQHVRSLCEFDGKLPDRSLFSGHAPAKIDARRAALNAYFDAMLDTPMDEKAALVVCEFLSSDVISREEDRTISPTDKPKRHVKLNARGKPCKEGYLTKRGKNFGGWKARYFTLDGPELRYFESDGGAHLGTIRLQNAQIGKQSQQQNESPSRKEEDADNQYRHAFLILEPKKKDSTSLVRHVLCAESDGERDAWVDALLQYVDYREEAASSPAVEKASDTAPARVTKPHPDTKQRRKDSPPEGKDKHVEIRGMSYDDTVAAEAPKQGPALRSAKSPISPAQGHIEQDRAHPHPSISAPTNGGVIQDAGRWGNRALQPPQPMSVKEKKRSIFAGFGALGRAIADSGPVTPSGFNRPPPNQTIFGIPLAEAVECSRPAGVHAQLPAVVYRSIEYLQAQNAQKEEGIFRLSGSNIVIRGLRERFNNEGDVRLLDGQYYDVHAVASLLKLYLRELPSSILTRDMHLDFLKVLDLDKREDKIASFNVLVHRLPRVNYELIQALSLFLIDIVDNADVNKMTVRNVGIVFAPTLNIPAPLISFFLTDYADIFGTAIDEAQSPIREVLVSAPVDDNSLRSPRHQMFSDLPTPAFNQTSFGGALGLPMPNANKRMSAAYNTGFIPLQPSYDTPKYGAHAPANNQAQYSHAQPAYEPVTQRVTPGQQNRSAPQQQQQSRAIPSYESLPSHSHANGSHAPLQQQQQQQKPTIAAYENISEISALANASASHSSHNSHNTHRPQVAAYDTMQNNTMTSKDVKARRRESSMMYSGVSGTSAMQSLNPNGQHQGAGRKGSLPQLREEGQHQGPSKATMQDMRSHQQQRGGYNDESLYD